MPISPLNAAMDLVSLDLRIAGKSIADNFIVFSIAVKREVYALARAKIVLHLPLDADEGTVFAPAEAKELRPGSAIEIRAGYENKNQAIFSGRIAGRRLRTTSDGARLELRCREQAGPDWASRRTRAIASGQLLYLHDGRPVEAPPASGGDPALELTYGNDILSFDLDLDAKTDADLDPASGQTPGADPKSKALSLDVGSKLAAKLKRGQGVSASPQPATTGDPQTLQRQLGPLRGTVSFPGSALPQLNTPIRLQGLGKPTNGDRLITRIRHRIEAGTWSTTVGFGLPARAKRSLTRLPASGARVAPTGIAGLQTGTVVSLGPDPQRAYRIQVDLSASGAGHVWARLAQFYATDHHGIFFLPEPGDEVVVGFLNGDPDEPVVVGMLYSSDRPSPYMPEPSNPIKAIVTRENLKIAFDDDQKILTLETPAGNRVVCSDKDQSIWLQDQNGNQIEMTSAGISIKSVKDITLNATGRVTVRGQQNISVKSAGGNISAAAMQIDLKAQTAFSAQGNASAELKASGQTTIQGAMVRIN